MPWKLKYRQPLSENPPWHPKPQSLQQNVKCSADICRLNFPLVAMHSRSANAPVVPKAYIHSIKM